MLSEIIRHKIETRFGRPIRYSKDCEALSLSIARACHERVSATTLKRLFGFARQIESPRRSTLNVIAQYAGYQDWEFAIADGSGSPGKQRDTKMMVEHGDAIFALHKQLSKSISLGRVDTEQVISLCEAFGHLPAIIPFINEHVNIASQEGNLPFLKKVFDLPNVFRAGTHQEAQLYYIGQSMGFTLRRHPEWGDTLIPVLAANHHAQQYLIEWFVDEDYLTGYYGRLLDVYHLHRGISLQDRLFYYAMKFTQAFQEKDAAQQAQRYQQLRELTLTDNIFCIPAARYTGIRLTVEREKKAQEGSFFCRLMDKYVRHRPYDEAIGFTMYGCRQLFAGDRPDWLCYLVNLYQQTYGKSNPVSQLPGVQRFQNELWVYRAYSAWLDGDQSLAREYISRVDNGFFDPFIYQGMMRDYEKVRQLIG